MISALKMNEFVSTLITRTCSEQHNSEIFSYIRKKKTLNPLYSKESANPGLKTKTSCKLSSSITPFFSPEADNPDQCLR